MQVQSVQMFCNFFCVCPQLSPWWLNQQLRMRILAGGWASQTRWRTMPTGLTLLMILRVHAKVQALLVIVMRLINHHLPTYLPICVHFCNELRCCLFLSPYHLCRVKPWRVASWQTVSSMKHILHSCYFLNFSGLCRNWLSVDQPAVSKLALITRFNMLSSVTVNTHISFTKSALTIVIKW